MAFPSDDGAALREYATEIGARIVLEFGPGKSTSWLFGIPGVERVISAEHNPGWFERARESIGPAVPSHVRWDLITYENSSCVQLRNVPALFDLVFVDSPRGDIQRERILPLLPRVNTLAYALNHGRHVVLHDADRDGEQRSLKFLGAEVKTWLTTRLAVVWRPAVADHPPTSR